MWHWDQKPLPKNFVNNLVAFGGEEERRAKGS